jgi:serine phosphatase RsbU (regulator of sigma subunit)
MYTDGLSHAGDRNGNPMDVCTLLEALLEDQNPSSQEVANTILEQALHLDENRPADDISVVVMRTVAVEGDGIRRMTVTLPIQSFEIRN